jgi:hypothetical protein
VLHAGERDSLLTEDVHCGLVIVYGLGERFIRQRLLQRSGDCLGVIERDSQRLACLAEMATRWLMAGAADGGAVAVSES